MNKQQYNTNTFDWKNLSFEYIECPYRFQANYIDGKWDSGGLLTDHRMNLHESSVSLHYGQQCFEGMKAQRTKSGNILLFRPELNWQRMRATALRLLMPELPQEIFMEGIIAAVKANADFVPPYGTGASLYIRPLFIGLEHSLGLKPAKNYIFRVFTSPVGPYYSTKSGDIKPLTLKISQTDRVPSLGIGAYKAGANYAGVLFLQDEARTQGFDEVLFLDPLEHKYIEETGSSNVVIYLKDRSFVTPKAPTILPSVTRKSICTIAKEILKLQTSERKIDFQAEVKNFVEFANCGTAAILSPVGKIVDTRNNEFAFYNEGKSSGPIMLELREILTSIQNGDIEDKFGWTYKI